MLLLERPDFGSANYDSAKRSAIPDKWHREDTPMTILTCNLSSASELGTGVLQIVDADGAHVANGTTRYGGTI